MSRRERPRRAAAAAAAAARIPRRAAVAVTAALRVARAELGIPPRSLSPLSDLAATMGGGYVLATAAALHATAEDIGRAAVAPPRGGGGAPPPLPPFHKQRR